MGKFELFLLLLGIGALAFFSQMPPSGSANTSPTGATNSSFPQPFGPGSGSGTIEGFPILARFSSDSFKAVDGDSIRMKTADAGEVDLRLASIDAPEWNQKSGQAAKKHLEEMITGRRATFLQTDTDRYQRAIVFMFVDGVGPGGIAAAPVEVNAQMVADGFAWHAIQFSSSERLKRMEANAKAKRLGLWSDASPQPPWEYRERK